MPPRISQDLPVLANRFGKWRQSGVSESRFHIWLCNVIRTEDCDSLVVGMKCRKFSVEFWWPSSVSQSRTTPWEPFGLPPTDLTWQSYGNTVTWLPLITYRTKGAKWGKAKGLVPTKKAKTNKYIEMPTSPLQKFMTLQGSVMICVISASWFGKIWQVPRVPRPTPLKYVKMAKHQRRCSTSSTSSQSSDFVPGLPTLRVWINRRHRMDRMESITGCADAYGDYMIYIWLYVTVDSCLFLAERGCTNREESNPESHYFLNCHGSCTKRFQYAGVGMCWVVVSNLQAMTAWREAIWPPVLCDNTSQGKTCQIDPRPPCLTQSVDVNYIFVLPVWDVMATFKKNMSGVRIIKTISKK